MLADLFFTNKLRYFSDFYYSCHHQLSSIEGGRSSLEKTDEGRSIEGMIGVCSSRGRVNNPHIIVYQRTRNENREQQSRQPYFPHFRQIVR